MVICGYKNVDFKDKAGNQIKGVSVHVAFEAPEDHGRGMLTDKFFISDEQFKNFRIQEIYKNNSEVELFYNKYGKVEQVKEIKSDK